MQLYAGTSGFSSKEWKGVFYPPDWPDKKMLEYYAERLPTVEINNTFYQMPKAASLEKWQGETPKGFRFALKAPRRITHIQKLRGSDETVAHLFKTLAVMEGKLGPVLFQLPPSLRKDLLLLQDFLALVPPGRPVAFEFRHPTWFGDDVYTLLRSAGAALCGGDVDDAEKSPPLVTTAPFGYLRLRRTDYSPDEISTWAERILAEPWEEAYVFLKHEQQGPALAKSLGRAFGAAWAAPPPKS